MPTDKQPSGESASDLARQPYSGFENPKEDYPEPLSSSSQPEASPAQPASSPHATSSLAAMANPGMPTTTHVKPPLRFDREFHHDPNNQLKIVQLAIGAFAFVLTNNCYPNAYVSYCTTTLHSFFQLFNVVCVHSFFFIGTAILALCCLLSVPDAYYRYNFPLLEKFYTALATVMYLLASTVVVINLFHAVFSFIWIFQVSATIVAFLAYAYDFWRRWKSDSQHGVV